VTSAGEPTGKPGKRGAVRIRTALVALLAVALAGCGRQSALDPQSPAAHDIATLWWWMLLAACVVFSGALGMLGLAWVRRRREGMPVVGGSSGRNLAMVVIFGIAIPITVNITLFVVANFVVLDRTDVSPAAAARAPIKIEVIGRQWFWEVRYPGTAAVSANEIHIPARTTVTIEAVTGDVIHSFWVPQLNRKIDMIPGRTNRVQLYADKPGVYRGQCAEFCGLEHAHMAMYVYADPPDRFSAWLRAESAPAKPSQSPGARTFFASQCASCHTIRGTAAKGGVGPDLTHVGSRSTLAALTIPNDEAALGDWLRDPQHVKPGNHMPSLDLSSADVRNLVAYLEGLK
jgi:cytochrome c oxidase subunit 2